MKCYFIPFQESELVLRLEMVACHGNCSSFKLSEIALVLLCISLDTAFNQLNTKVDANMSTDRSSIIHHTATTSTHDMLKNELAQFIVEIRRKCEVSLHFFLDLYYILYYCASALFMYTYEIIDILK